MKFSHSTLQLAAMASLAAMAVGCQADGSSRWHLPRLRRTPDCHYRSQYAAVQPGYSFENSVPAPAADDEPIRPGHSIDSPEHFAPSPVEEPMYPAPPAPAPLPQADDQPSHSNPDIPGSQPPAPVIQEEVRLRHPQAPAQKDQVRGDGEPERLSPFSVRSIYEKLRPGTNEPEQVEDGPIANHGRLESMTRVVDFRNVSAGREGMQPVTLGVPETEEIEAGGDATEYAPPVMQATPSSYRHPMLADPTGMPYGVIN